MNFLLPIIAVFMLIFSVIDLKYKKIPSVFLTGFLFFILALNPEHLFFGVLAFVFAYMMYEFDFISGIADIKLITALALVISGYFWFFLYIILILLFGVVWKFIIQKRIKKAKEIAFIPVLLFAFITLWILGGIV